MTFIPGSSDRRLSPDHRAIQTRPQSRTEDPPPELLGRVSTVGQALSWSAIPAGALVGGWLIEATSVVVVFAGIGALKLLLAVAFSFTAIRTVR